MQKKFLSCLLILVAVIGTTTATAAEQNILNTMSLKVTVIQNGIEKEWEYTNPDEFEVEVGNTVTKGEEAEQQVRELFNRLQLNEKAEAEKMVEVMKTTYKLDRLERLDIRWINRDGKLYTWVWENE